MNVKLLDLQAQYKPIREEIRAALDEVFDQQSLVLGPHVEKFEKNLAAYCGTKHAIGVSSGKDAILCALMAMGIGPGDEAIMPAHLFGQCANMDAINAIAAKHKLKVVEDAAQAIGATFNGKRACSLAD